MGTPKLLQKIEIFVSSPGDVSVEREVVARVVERLNRLAYIRERYYLQVMAYEELVPPVVGDAPQMVVDKYMMKAEQSDLIICLFWARMGTPVTHPATGEHFQSGTEYEFISAYRANQKTGKPYILLYQKIAMPPTSYDPQQFHLVKAFFRRFEGDKADFKGLYKRFTTPEEFEEMLFQHIEQVITTDILKSKAVISADTVPEYQEETRRLDAAMPGQTKIGRPTEVWVQICIPSSEGFRNMLPAFTKSRREEITVKDVRAGNLAIAFPIDRATGRPLPIRVSIELRSPDFEIQEPRQEVMLSPRADSGMLTFNLTPTQARERAVVHVSAKQTMPDGTVITLGATTLTTQVHGASFVFAAAQIAWNLLSVPLSAVEVASRKRSFDPSALQTQEREKAFPEEKSITDRLSKPEPTADRKQKEAPGRDDDKPFLEEEAIIDRLIEPEPTADMRKKDVSTGDDPYDLFADDEIDLDERAETKAEEAKEAAPPPPPPQYQPPPAPPPLEIGGAPGGGVMPPPPQPIRPKPAVPVQQEAQRQPTPPLSLPTPKNYPMPALPTLGRSKSGSGWVRIAIIVFVVGAVIVALLLLLNIIR